MAREVLGHCRHMLLKAANGRGTLLGNAGGVFAEGTYADHGVEGIAVHIHHWCKGHVHPRGRELQTCHRADLLGDAFIPNSP